MGIRRFAGRAWRTVRANLPSALAGPDGIPSSEARVKPSEVLAVYQTLSLERFDLARAQKLQRLAIRENWTRTQLFLNLVDCPEIADNLGFRELKQADVLVPIRHRCGLTVFGFPWDMFVTREVRRTGTWEPHIEAFIKEKLRPGDVAFDIGANIGCHTALMSVATGPDGKVYAFEPAAYVFKSLEKMKLANDLQNVELFPVAAGDRKAVLPLAMHHSSPGGNSLLFGDVESKVDVSDCQPVKVEKLDDLFLSSLSRLDLIKIDIEGGEAAALRGARQLIEKFRPAIISEFSPPGHPVQGLRSGRLFAGILGSWISHCSPWTRLPVRQIGFFQTGPDL